MHSGSATVCDPSRDNLDENPGQDAPDGKGEQEAEEFVEPELADEVELAPEEDYKNVPGAGRDFTFPEGSFCEPQDSKLLTLYMYQAALQLRPTSTSYKAYSSTGEESASMTQAGAVP